METKVCFFFLRKQKFVYRTQNCRLGDAHLIQYHTEPTSLL